MTPVARRCDVRVPVWPARLRGPVACETPAYRSKRLEPGSSATGWVKRLRLLELLKDGIALCTGADTKDWARGVVEAIPDLVEPVFWWGFTQDVALMQGVHKHGYGSYDARYFSEDGNWMWNGSEWVAAR